MRTRDCLVVFVCLLCAVSATATEFLGKIAFLRDGDLWVRDAPDGAPRQVTTSGNALHPEWSASGRWLSYREGESLWIENVISPGNPRRIAADSPNSAWSPTADVLAYTRAPGGLYLAGPGLAQDQLLVADLPGTPSTIDNFAWSPDGTQLAFVRVRTVGAGEDDRMADLFVTTATGAIAQRRLLSVPGSRYRPIIIGWTPDGRYILFLQGLAYSASLLADGVPLAAVAAAGGPVRVFTQNTSVIGGLAVSPDGHRLAVLQRPGRESWRNARLFISPVGTVRLRALTGDAEAPLFPAWSPQGNLLAYVTGPAGSPSLPLEEADRLFAQRHVVLVDPDAGVRRGETRTGDNRDEYPLWTADGRHLLFTRITPEGQASVWVLNRQANTQQSVVERISPADPDTGWTGFYGTVDWPAVLGWWPGQRLALPGLLYRQRTYAPLRATVEALGGAVSWQAETRTVTAALDNRSFTRTLGDDGDDLVLRGGVLYARAIVLQRQFGLGLHWNAPAREAVAVNTPGARIIIIPTRAVACLDGRG